MTAVKVALAKREARCMTMRNLAGQFRVIMVPSDR